jgi:hypothetical protein
MAEDQAGVYPVVRNGEKARLWEMMKWIVGILLTILAFGAVTFGFNRISNLEDRVSEDRAKIERIDERTERMEKDVHYIRDKIDRQK